MKEYIVTLHIGVSENNPKFDIKDFEAFLDWTASNRPSKYTEEQANQQDKEYNAYLEGIHSSELIGFIEATKITDDISSALLSHEHSLKELLNKSIF